MDPAKYHRTIDHQLLYRKIQKTLTPRKINYLSTKWYKYALKPIK